jgi:excisionase family DNA binding protein
MIGRAAYSLEEARELLGGCSRSHLYRLAKRGELRLVRVGHRRLVPASEIERLAEGRALIADEPRLRVVREDDG